MLLGASVRGSLPARSSRPKLAWSTGPAS